jgi:hypothetical protein
MTVLHHDPRRKPTPERCTLRRTRTIKKEDALSCVFAFIPVYSNIPSVLDKNRLHHGLTVKLCTTAPPSGGAYALLYIQLVAVVLFFSFCIVQRTKHCKHAKVCCFIIFCSRCCADGGFQAHRKAPPDDRTALPRFRDVSEQAPV